MYTFGQEGETVNCNIFKDQKAPIIRNIDKYPYIWKFLQGVAWSRTRVEFDELEERGLMNPDLRAQYWLQWSKHRRGMMKLKREAPLPPKKQKSSRGKK